MSNKPTRPPHVWGIEATIAGQPLYRHPNLTEREWARRQLKYMAAGTKVYLLPFLVSFFHRREEDYRTCSLCPTSNNLRRGGGWGMRVSGVGHKHGCEFFINEHTIALFWLSNLRVVNVEDKCIKNAILERVWSFKYFVQNDPDRMHWLYSWVGSDEAKDKWEEIREVLQRMQQREADENA